ncbi:micro-fibrillar-associated protein 1 C-terminus protein [Toxoplasma gondii TgCatPRC2]|uniref:Micro-fibrillar-associated protein 1 n=18 Tax=Toxoplasma gondii TaxID=5811 RepID=B9PZK4_TOXGV|nr:micro-fibrillar-associated protein 1 [Toxoplasma gondii ME49]EPR60195.1 micro-fibrillar-associated protein 1 [Toxoplasma gondii GT1]ESS31119.1 micro-fibrillar-associated protein 1 [Toxoplasma gondii VEG]KAF4640067.1 micro-fibrillar-associated protein 1 [Toxoplasma gondii]KFG35947.1 micro-fibrillar-associated protein 1 C-terminus protein [Toxoplasma gondii GAB2-2007-GAL-DOM2]KYF42928.1 micro-fibrillar-associated protein 1 C-terminus protein [Toxoplasma gondii ARI]KYK67956.1 micro-fibrillar-|eukprot:XP_002370790.1 micro-fibrillar-associated protein 1 [Toxoplasma gondii ME49]
MSAADVHSILYRGADPMQQKFEPQKDKKVTVPRYWPGKVPDKAEDDLSGSSDEEDVAVKQQRMQAVLQESSRLHRLARAATTLKPDLQERRRIHEAIVIEAAKERELLAEKEEEEENEEDEEEEETDEARERRRRLALARRREEEKLLEEQQRQHQLEEEEEDDSSSAYTTDSDDNEDPAFTILHKPVFVPKEKRETVKERERLEAEEEKERKEAEERLADRKRESKKLLYEALQKEDEEMRTNMLGEQLQEEDCELPDDTDGLDAEAEYEAWKARELLRIKRDQEERQARDNFLEALERRRQMTEEERRLDDKQLDAMQPRREVKYKYNFMQKYYHRGAFFQDLARSGEEALYLRDYNAPVGEDKWDKKILPSAMRVRRGEFGRQGQTKHTHLVDVDTTDFTSAWAFNTKIKEKTDSKMGGRKGAKEFDRPAARPKK